jgi:hypothetical protein
VLGEVESRKELLLSLERFKAGLSCEIGGSSMKASLWKVWENKGEQACQGALDLLVDGFKMKPSEV